MSTIYTTNEWNGYGKQNYYWNEYRLEGNSIVKYKCNRHKFFVGNENNWEESETEVESWNINDSNLPNWLREYI
ncbi:hypothetical protein [Enterococcus sp. S177_ASV_20]|uniref:hypothetical protein n=1 Tax=Enterococcus sp. S177_ASV_20 TaxID=2847007 RepID=UPI001C0F253B|nr:hypothetical protein [Enterococcus sp. S177_ASV_20]MBU5494279.1 hypothetical protein [Enterococcus sp. S177_ASV_20]